jgi:hypothetical protein
MAFETFKRQRTKPGEPFLTIQRKGVFSLNRAAFELMGEPEAVELLYDPDSKLIGLRKSDPEVHHAYVVRSLGGRGGDSTFLISGMAFTNYYGIDTSTTTRRTPSVDGDILIVDLKDPGTPVTSNRRTKADEQPALPLGSS